MFVLAAAPAAADPTEPYTPTPGQPGKDVVWVPTPEAMVERMLDIARATPDDFVIDLGSGDGRTVIAAARRGIPALGVEYNEKLVELSRANAQAAGVADKASFVQGDMYEADISKASVMILFLLPENLDKLADKFLDLRPGSRIVLNTFPVSGWSPDYSEKVQQCDIWCTVHLYVVPAKVDGTWQWGDGTLQLKQAFQFLQGTLTRDGKTLPIADGQLRGDRISFAIDGTRYEGHVDGDRIAGEAGADGKNWSARRTAAKRK
jgi:hypothetical protein